MSLRKGEDVMGIFHKGKKDDKPNPVSLITMFNKRSVISEQYRTIRSNIRFSMVDKDLKSLVITSAGPNEGKSTVANNLAVVFADAGLKTLLVDADLRKPTADLTWALSRDEGLSNLLVDKTSNYENYVSKTKVEGLFVLTSGHVPPNPSELLGTERMQEILQTLTQNFDLVIFDTPPLTAVTDAQILASRTDGTILVVRERQRDKREILLSKQLLEMAQANVLGVVFNGTKASMDDYYYYGSKS